MQVKEEHTEFELISVIVNFGLGSKVLKSAKQHGIKGGTVLLGKGTVNNRILEFLAITDVRKEIVLMIAEKPLAEQAVVELDKEFSFSKPHHGIAFTLPVSWFIGSRYYGDTNITESKGVTNTMYKAIFTVVEKGKAEEVVETATAAGSRGATIINARGSGIHETSTLFAMPIEPEKEIVLILAKAEATDAIASAIREHLKIDEPGNGIMFIVDVNKTYGLA